VGLPQEAPDMFEDKHIYNHLRAKVEEVRVYLVIFRSLDMAM
jgi:hypothetical protein